MNWNLDQLIEDLLSHANQARKDSENTGDPVLAEISEDLKVLAHVLVRTALSISAFQNGKITEEQQKQNQ